MPKLEESEYALVEKARRRDEGAIAQIYDLYVDKIFKYVLYKVGHKAEAEDLTGQVFIKAIEALPRFNWRNVPLSAWLFSIAHNLVIDHYRSRGRRSEIDIAEVPNIEDPAADPCEAVSRGLAKEKLSHALKVLTEEQRQVICLKFFSGFSNAEIAAILGKTEGAVKSIQHRGLKALKTFLEGDNE